MSSTPFEKHTAIRVQDNGELALDAASPFPTLQPNTILVKTVAVALNPTDHKMATRFPIPGMTIGCDFAGTIVALGPGVPDLQQGQGRMWKVGDHVFGGIHGANPADPTCGTFGEYLVADADFVFKAPEWMDWKTAAALGGVGIGTVGLALFQYLKPPGTLEEPLNSEKDLPVLVNGGATASGTMAIQLLKLAGLTPIATCSPQNFALVKSYGAAHVFDYNNPAKAIATIKELTRNSLKYVVDCVATSPAQNLSHSCIGRLGGTYIALELPPPKPDARKAIKSDFVLGMTLLGKEIALGEGYYQPPIPEHRVWGVKYYEKVQTLLDHNMLKAHPPRVMTGGLQGIQDEGLPLLKEGKIRAEKLVYFV